jgi:hypothetical protein
MLSLPAAVKIHRRQASTDMRQSFDSRAALAEFVVTEDAVIYRERHRPNQTPPHEA